MEKLEEIYNNIENPIENQEILQKLITAYQESSKDSLYEFLVKMNENNDNSKINLEDMEAFYVESYNQWIENMINLDDKQINYLENTMGEDAREMRQYLQNFGKVKTLDDIEKLKSNPLFEKEINGWELSNSWEHIKSQYISARKEDKISVKHRLYIGCKNQDIWKLAKLFKNKCDDQQLPYYFKLIAAKNRDDKIVIYADTDNLGNYIKNLQEIAKENPEIIQRCSKPPALTGKIDNWIGIGDEPPLDKNGKNQSYNTLRANIINDAIEKTMLSNIMKFRGKEVTYKGEQTKFNELFEEQAAQAIIDRLDKGNKESYFRRLSLYELKEQDLTNIKFKKYIERNLTKNIQKGLNEFAKNENKNKTTETIFTIPTRKEKSINIDFYNMDAIVKNMVPIIKEINPNFISQVKSQIQEKCKENGIDDTFCFQQETKTRFKEADIKNSKENKKEREPQHSSIRKQFEEMKAKEEERKAKNAEEKSTLRKQFEKIGKQKEIKENPKRTDTGDDSRGEKIEMKPHHSSIHKQDKGISEEKENNFYSQFKKIEENNGKIEIPKVKESILRSKITKSETEKTMGKIKKTRERNNNRAENQYNGIER